MSFPAYPTCKDSGSEWIGAIPDHWSASPLKKTFKIEGGSTPPPDEVNWDGDIAWVTPADLSGLPSLFLEASKRTITVTGLASCGTTLLPAGSLILSTRAPIGSLAIALISMCTNQGCKGLVPNANSFVAYFAFVLLTAKGELNNRGRGSTFLEISGDELSRFSVPTPPFAEQTQIARFLDHETARIDALIEEQQRLIELLKEKRQAVISHAVTKGLDPTVPMKDSGVEWLGEVPADWAVSPLKFLVEEKVAGPYGASLTKAMYTDSGYRVYGQQQVISDDFSIGDYYISEEKFSEMQRYVVCPGDVLVSVMGTIGRVSVVPVGVEVGIINPRLVRYKFASSKVVPEFIKILLMSLRYQSRLREESQGSTMEGLNMVILGDLPLVLPPLDAQNPVVAFVKSYDSNFNELVSQATSAVDLLQERRSALISAAVTGKIDVRGWQPPASALTPELAQEAV